MHTNAKYLLIVPILAIAGYTVFANNLTPEERLARSLILRNEAITEANNARVEQYTKAYDLCVKSASGSSEQILEKYRDCKNIAEPKLEPLVTTGNTSWTLTPGSSGVPWWHSSINSSLKTYELNRTIQNSSWQISVSWPQIIGITQAKWKEVGASQENPEWPTRTATQDINFNWKTSDEGQRKALSATTIEILRETQNLSILEELNLEACRVVQDEDSHITKARGHVYATDIACTRGQSFTVSAPNWKKEYTVKAVGQDKRIGNYIVLEHKNYMFVFGHTVSPHKVGEKILAGTQIGYSDNSWLSTNVHLHFELWRDGYNITADEMFGRGSRWNDEYSLRLLVQRGWYTGIDEAIDFITSFEWYRDTSYEDPKDSWRWSIWYGTYASGPWEKISKDEAKKRIKSKVFENMEFIYQKRLALTWNERIALSSFFYNLGTTRPEMVEALKKRDMVALEKLWKSYINKGSIYESGLTKRRVKEWSKFTSK